MLLQKGVKHETFPTKLSEWTLTWTMDMDDIKPSSDVREAVESSNTTGLEEFRSETFGYCYRNHDPSGQRSVYIPPGDATRESYRLRTFMDFPQDVPVSSMSLAAAGFYYTGYKDRVRCFCCGTCVEDWVAEDDVTSSRWHESDCKMMLEQECGNVPIECAGILFPPFRGSFIDEYFEQTGEHFYEIIRQFYRNILRCKQVRLSQDADVIRPAAGADGPSDATSPRKPRKSPLRTTPAVDLQERRHDFPCNYPVNPYRADEEVRCKTFDDRWPQCARNATPRQLAEAGFYFLGERDKVKCFHCNGSLQNWEPDDDPWKEHAKWYPMCEYLLQSKGQDFVHPVANARTNLKAEGPFDGQLRCDAQKPLLASTPFFIDYQQQKPQLIRKKKHRFPCRDPVNPDMSDENARLVTFGDRWPQRLVNATPSQVSKAGFFYFGDGDKAQCWYCNGGVQNWGIEDDPWTEHAKWFPKCEFLHRSKDLDDVNSMASGTVDVKSQCDSRKTPLSSVTINDSQIDLESAFESTLRPGRVKALLGRGVSAENVKPVKIKLEREHQLHESVSTLKEVEVFKEAFLRKVFLEKQPHDDETVRSENVGVLKEDLIFDEQHGRFFERRSSADETDEAIRVAVDRLYAIAKEIKELKDERRCKICLDGDADVVFIPCGHVCSCMRCAGWLDACPICRGDIQKRMRTFTD